MKVALVYPPECVSLWMPSGSTPALNAYLKEGGVEATQYDFNIEVYDRILRPEPLLDLWKKTPWKKNLPSPAPVTPGRKKTGEMLAKKIDDITGGIEEALSAFRSAEKFFDHESYSNALRIMDDAMLLVSAAGWELDNALESPVKAIEAAMNPSINVYLSHLDKLVEKVASKKPGMMGLSVIHSRQMIPAIAVAKLVREKLPDIHIFLNGAYPTTIAHSIENSPELFDVFDSVAISEAEVASLGLARAVENGSKISEVPGIFHREGDNVVRTSLPVMEDADVLPAPNFDQLPLKKYLSPEPVLPVFSSRGCYWRRCAYCLRADRKTFSQRNPQQVVKDLTALKRRYKTRAFHFTDNAIRPRRMAEIADGITEAGLEVSWTAATRFSPEMTWDWCDQIAAGGCARIIFSIESASKMVLDRMDKGFRIEDVPGVLQGLSKAGVDSTLCFMVGFPGEKTEDVRKTMQFIERLQDSLTPYAQYYVSLFAPAHGSNVHQNREQFGIKNLPERAPNDLKNPYYYDFEVSNGMSSKEAVKLYREFIDRIEKLHRQPFRMPHDMLIQLAESQEGAAKAVEAKVLNLHHVPKLADDIRAEKGYLLKGNKRFRIDESLRDLIGLIDSKRTVKEIIKSLSKTRKIPATTSFVYTQQLYEEGLIEVSGAVGKKSGKAD